MLIGPSCLNVSIPGCGGTWTSLRVVWRVFKQGRHPLSDNTRPIPFLANSPSGQFPFWPIPLLDNSPTGQFPSGTIPLLDNSPSGQFPSWTIPLLDNSPPRQFSQTIPLLNYSPLLNPLPSSLWCLKWQEGYCQGGELPGFCLVASIFQSSITLSQWAFAVFMD